MAKQKDKSLHFFHFLVRSTEKPKWYHLGRPALAEVFAHLLCLDMDDGREAIHKDMHGKGYTIEKILQGKLFEKMGFPPEENRRLESTVKEKAQYMIYGLSGADFEKKVGKSRPPKITSRYVDDKNVVIKLSKIPKELHGLIPYARIWAIGDDVERSDFINHASGKKKAFYQAVSRKRKAVEAYCNKHRQGTPVPDEVVLFDWMMEAFAEISPECESGEADGTY